MTSLKQCVERGLRGAIPAEERGAAWRVLLGVVKPGSDPSVALRLSREAYAKLREVELPDVASASKDDEGDPLSAMVGSSSDKKDDAWSKYYASADLRVEVRKDLDRLTMKGLPDDYFQTSVEAMLAVLTVWAGAKSTCGYRQGMHEVLALVVLALHNEKKREASTPACGFFEADAFALFDAIMAGLLPLFAVDPEPSGGGLRRKKKQNKPDSPVLKLCKSAAACVGLLDASIGKIVDAVEPQLYGLRWTRLLFAREFSRSPSEPLALCDGLFAMAAEGLVSDLLGAVECVFIALVIANKRRLQEFFDDYGDPQMAALSVLMRPQDVAAAHVLDLAAGPALQVFHSHKLNPETTQEITMDAPASPIEPPPNYHRRLNDQHTPEQTPLFVAPVSANNNNKSPLKKPSAKATTRPPPSDPFGLVPAASPPRKQTTKTTTTTTTVVAGSVVKGSVVNRGNPLADLAVLLEDAIFNLDRSIDPDNLTARRAISQVADVASRLRLQPGGGYN